MAIKQIGTSVYSKIFVTTCTYTSTYTCTYTSTCIHIEQVLHWVIFYIVVSTEISVAICIPDLFFGCYFCEKSGRFFCMYMYNKRRYMYTSTIWWELYCYTLCIFELYLSQVLHKLNIKAHLLFFAILIKAS